MEPWLVESQAERLPAGPKAESSRAESEIAQEFARWEHWPRPQASEPEPRQAESKA